MNASVDKDKEVSFHLHRKSSLTQLEISMFISVQDKDMDD